MEERDAVERSLVRGCLGRAGRLFHGATFGARAVTGDAHSNTGPQTGTGRRRIR